jgi:hypothetical protein
MGKMAMPFVGIVVDAFGLCLGMGTEWHFR